MTDDLDAQVVAALRTLEQEPTSDGRAAVARRVSRRKLRRSGALVGVAATLALVVAVVVVVNGNHSPRRITLGGSGASTSVPSASFPTPPPLAAADAGILTFPSIIAPGDDLSAVLRNPLGGANVSCFRAVRLERWDGSHWLTGRELQPKGIDPNGTSPGAECAPDLLLPGAFIGEKPFTIPRDAAPGNYRLVDQATGGEGRITVLAAGSNPPDVIPPTSRHTIDLSQGADLLIDGVRATIARAIVLDDNRLAIAWNSACNAPGQRIDFDYEPDGVRAHLVVGAYRVKDCLGPPPMWSTVVDLPAPLWGRAVVVYSGDHEVTAEPLEATPISTFVLPDVAPGSANPPILATSIGFQRRTPVSIQVDVFAGACITDAQSVVLRAENGEIFVQPHVQEINDPQPGDACLEGPGDTRTEMHVEVPAGAPIFGPNG